MKFQTAIVLVMGIGTVLGAPEFLTSSMESESLSMEESGADPPCIMGALIKAFTCFKDGFNKDAIGCALDAIKEMLKCFQNPELYGDSYEDSTSVEIVGQKKYGEYQTK